MSKVPEVWPNEPAFPANVSQRGMTLRTWLAAKAMAGMLAKGADKSVFDTPDATAIAMAACRYADALVDQLNKGST